MNAGGIELPELTRARQDEIETALFADIRADAARAREHAHRRRRRAWSYSGAAAAVILIAGFIGPAVGGSGLGLGGGAMSESAGIPDSAAGGGALPEDGADLGDGQEDGTTSAELAEREVIARASTALEADDPAAAAQEIGERAEASGGYVESLTVSAAAPDAAEGDAAVSTAGDAWITVRVPAADLPSFLTDLDDLGEVLSSEISQEDVTAESTDLRARISALEASVDRLQGLISDAATTADLLTAEDALAARQAELDALRARADALADDVALSSATITITAPNASVAAAEPQGFGDGLATGWSALVTAGNGILIGLGFLLPWLVAAGVVVTVVQLVRRARRRAPTEAGSSEE